MEAPWMKKHKEVMELEEKKSKLLSELELLRQERYGLADSLTEIQENITAKNNDFSGMDEKHLNVIADLDKKLSSLKSEMENATSDKKQLSAELIELKSSIEKLKESKENRQLEIKELEDSIENLKSSLDELKLKRQDEENWLREILKNLKEQLSLAKEELLKTQEDSVEIKERILNETKLLSIKRSDLQIYETRMGKKYPNEVFILKDATFTKN